MDQSKLCFICLNDTTTPKFNEFWRLEVDKEKHKLKLLTSYILQSTSSSLNEDQEKSELQTHILSDLSEGRTSICSECLAKADKITELHLELEKIQIQILELLKNLQDQLKCSKRDGTRMEELDTFSRFQDVLEKEFMQRKLSDGTEVRLQRLSTAGYTQYLVLPKTPEHCHDEDNFPGSVDIDFDIGNHEDDADWEMDGGDDRGTSTENTGVKRPPSPFTKKKISSKGKASAARTARTGNQGKWKRPSKHHYECDICYELIAREYMEHHLKTHAQFEKYYKCEICPEGDRERIHGSYKGLVWHYLTFPHNVHMLCNLCPEKTILFAKRELCKHLYDFHQLDHKKLPCGFEDCSEEFCDPISRSKHRSYKHIAIAKPKVFTCQLCQITSKTKNAFRWHMRRHEVEELSKFKSNPQEDCVECPQCSKNVLRKYLDDHIEVMHGQAEAERDKLICDICKKSFKLKSSLDSHIQRIHTEGKGQLFVCDKCPKEFRSQISLHVHKKKSHEEIDLVVCPHCPKRFNIYTLPNHVKRVHGDKTFQCRFCPKAFRTQVSLTSHELAHRNEREYKCDECPFSGNTKQTLRRHKLTHKEKTIQCHYCPKKFSSNTRLKVHERNHTKERPYKCSVCDLAFIHSHTRYYHERNKHGLTGNNCPPLAKVEVTNDYAEKNACECEVKASATFSE